MGANAKVLILGSMPGVKSLQDNQYYAHPRNVFWWIMEQLFDASPSKPYQQRQQILIDRGIAVWDVLYRCKRKGSLDSAIEQDSLTPNEFDSFLATNQQIGAILFNGKMAETLFQRHVVRPGKCSRISCLRVLPSTSPANARLTPEQKLVSWRQTLSDLLGRKAICST